MLLSPFASFLGARTDWALRLLPGSRPVRPGPVRPRPVRPRFEGLLDELYASWPLEAAERERRRAA